MNHREIRRRMGEYLQGDLPLAQRALFDGHLDGCPACAAELSALRETIQRLRGLPTPDVPANLVDRVVARIADGEGRARPWDGLVAFWNWIDPARYLPPLAGAALTSAVVIVGVRDLGWQIPGMQAPPAISSESAPSAREPAEAAPNTSLRPAAPARRTATLTVPGPAPERVRAGAPAAAAAPEDGPPAYEVLHDPQLFLQHYRAVQAERREAWLRQMAEQAAHRRQVADVARRLRESAGKEGRDLADAFEAVAYPAGR